MRDQTSTRALLAGPYYHVGIVVRDLEAAMASYGETLGVTFPLPRVTGVTQVYNGTTFHHDVRAVFSREGPPYIELIQASVGVLGPEQEGLHHFGYSTHDVVGALQDCRVRKLLIEATLGKSGPVSAFFLSTAEAGGARIEFSLGGLLR